MTGTSIADQRYRRRLSNVQSGTAPVWYLFDASRAIKPIVRQERENYDSQAVIAPNDPHVSMTDQYLYDVRTRVDAGFELWHLAHASKAKLTEVNYDPAGVAMQMLRGDNKRGSDLMIDDEHQ